MNNTIKKPLVRPSLISESTASFTRGGEPRKTLGLSYGNKPQTTGWKILEFIRSKGEEGASFSEIQLFIWKLNGHKEEDFWTYEWERGWNHKLQRDTGMRKVRKTRGYWTTGLYSYGLLPNFCKKNNKGKWVFQRYPRPGENLFQLPDYY